MKKFVLELVHEIFECSLAFDEQADQMKLKVDDVEFEDILLAPEQVLMHRSQIINNFVGRVLSTEYPLLIGELFLKVVC